MVNAMCAKTKALIQKIANLIGGKERLPAGKELAKIVIKQMSNIVNDLSVRVIYRQKRLIQRPAVGLVRTQHRPDLFFRKRPLGFSQKLEQKADFVVMRHTLVVHTA